MINMTLWILTLVRKIWRIEYNICEFYFFENILYFMTIIIVYSWNFISTQLYFWLIIYKLRFTQPKFLALFHLIYSFSVWLNKVALIPNLKTLNFINLSEKLLLIFISKWKLFSNLNSSHSKPPYSLPQTPTKKKTFSFTTSLKKHSHDNCGQGQENCLKSQRIRNKKMS